MFNPAFLVLTTLALALCSLSHPVSGLPDPAEVIPLEFRSEPLGREASETLPRDTCRILISGRDGFPNTTRVGCNSGSIHSAFDETADLAFHLEDVQDFIDENKQCATINNTILLRFDKSFFKFYSGKFDEGLLNFISTSQGVSAIIPVQNVPDDDTSLPAEPLPADNHTEARSNIIEARRTGATWVGDDARITIEIYQHSPGIGADTQTVPVVLKPLLSVIGIGKNKGQGSSAISRDWTYKIRDDVNLGEDVAIYIVDSGVNAGHIEFGGRVVAVPDHYGDFGSSSEDLYGHGTAVASIAAGSSIGVASQADILPFRCSHAKEIKSTDHIIEAIGSAINHYIVEKRRQGGAVLNLSMNLPKDKGLDEVLLRAGKIGIHVVAAAGNENKDWCDITSHNGAIVVGAINIKDERSTWSNYGACVDVFAPGEDIIVADFAKPNGYTTKSGSSMAAPHVSGMVATIIATSGNLPPAQMRAKIMSMATRRFVKPENYPTSSIVTFDPSFFAT